GIAGKAGGDGDAGKGRPRNPLRDLLAGNFDDASPGAGLDPAVTAGHRGKSEAPGCRIDDNGHIAVADRPFDPGLENQAADVFDGALESRLVETVAKRRQGYGGND